MTGQPPLSLSMFLCNSLSPDVCITISVLDTVYKVDLALQQIEPISVSDIIFNMLDFSEFSGLFWKLSVVGVDRYR